MRSSLALSPIARLREVDARPTPEEAPAKAAGAHTLEKGAEALPHWKADVGRKPDGKPEGLTVQDAKNNRFHSLSCARRALMSTGHCSPAACLAGRVAGVFSGASARAWSDPSR